MLNSQVNRFVDRNHPLQPVGPVVAVYVWQYPLRLVHWGTIISLVILTITGYYIHNPYVIGQVKYPFMMGWIRFVHEAFAFFFAAMLAIRLYLFFKGSYFERWPRYVPYTKEQFAEMIQVSRFYMFLRPTPVSKVGHNAMAAFSYIGFYGLMAIEVITGLVMYNWLRHSPILTPLVGWIPRVVNIQTLREIHFFLMYVFAAFGIFHVHLCMLISRTEKRGLIDSMFVGYKTVPVHEMEEEEKHAALAHAKW